MAETGTGIVADRCRLEALRATGLLDTPPDEAFDRLTRLAVNALGVQAAFITLVDEHRDFYLSQFGVGKKFAIREHSGESFCRLMLQAGGPLIIPDTFTDPACNQVPLAKSLGIAAYAGIPLRLASGEAIGSLCVIDSKPHTWDEDEVRILNDLAQITIGEIERRNSETNLRTTETRYSELVENVPMGLYRTAPDGRFLDANERMATLLGYPDHAALLATPVPSLYVDPEDRVRWTEQLARGHIVRDYEVRLRKLNGEIIWVRDTTRVKFAPDGTVLYYEGALEDISAAVEAKNRLQQSEEYFRALIEKSQDMITVVEVDGTIRYESPAVFLALGYDQQELIGQNVLSLVHADDQARVLREFTTMLETGSPMVSARLRFQHKDGSWKILDATASNLASHPSVRGVVVNSRDVTERVTLEEQVRQGSKMEAIGQLAGGVAHDFNNMLTAIRGTTDLMLEDLADLPQAVEDLQEISKAADRATDLTKQLLAFSRRQVLQPKVVDLNEIITGMLVLLERLIGSHVQIVLRLDSRPVEVMVDPNQMERVILNLSVNARDAMPGGGELTIGTKCIRIPEDARTISSRIPDGDYVQFEVCDTGPGIKNEHLAHLFEPFYTTKPVGQGTGLGLATVFGIVKQSQGFVWAENIPSGGAAFRVLLPASKRSDDQLSVRETTAESLTGDETILVVDDEANVGGLAVKILRRFGYNAFATDNGQDAIKIISERSGKIDLLLTDVVMPRMRGPELARRIREVRPGIRVVYMSGFNEEAVTQQGVFEPGAFFLEKPFGVDAVVRMVRRALDAQTSG